MLTVDEDDLETLKSFSVFEQNIGRGWLDEDALDAQRVGDSLLPDMAATDGGGGSDDELGFGSADDSLDLRRSAWTMQSATISGDSTDGALSGTDGALSVAVDSMQPTVGQAEQEEEEAEDVRNQSTSTKPAPVTCCNCKTSFD